MSTTVRRRIAALATAAVLGMTALAGCTTTTGTDASGSTTVVAAQTTEEVLAANQEAHSADETDYDPDTATTITLSKDSATVAGAGTARVAVEGSIVTITGEGVYVLTGELDDGQVIIDAAEAHVTLVLDGVRIASSSGAAIAATDADEVTVITTEGSTNTLSDTDSYADDAEVNAALYSSADLTLAGTGSLTVHGNGNDGIATTDGLLITSGTVSVTAVDDGVRGKDYVVLQGGSVTVDAGGDAIKADNDEDATAGYVNVAGGVLALAAGDDGIDATTDLVISAGTVTVGSSVEGLEAAHLLISGGKTSVTSSDDGLNAAGASTDTADADTRGGGGEAVGDYSLVVAGGSVTVDAGGDGLDSNGTATITGGTVTVAGPEGNGNGALDVNGEFAVDGGILIAAGSAGMVVSPSTDSRQSWVSATLDTAVEPGTTLKLVGEDGAVIATYTTTKTVQNVVVSAADLRTGEEYRVVDGNTTVATVTAGEAAAGGMGGRPQR